MLWKKDEICPFTLEDGIVVDYMENRFVMIIKDDIWTDFEVQAFARNKLYISFLYERVCAMFLFTNVDSIDTSDASFDVHNCDEKEILLQQLQYDMEIYLVGSEHKIYAARSISFDKQASALIRSNLQKQMDTPYDDEGFDRALMKIQGSYEPFEMEEMALLKESF